MSSAELSLREEGNEVLELTSKEKKQSGGLLQPGAARDFFFLLFKLRNDQYFIPFQNGKLFLFH